jgi:hypothetical protein
MIRAHILAARPTIQSSVRGIAEPAPDAAGREEGRYEEDL